MKKLNLFLTATAALSLIGSSAAFAEGSRNLVGFDVQQEDGTYAYQKYSYAWRPYLSFTSNTNAGLRNQAVIYVYAKKGETINFGTSVVLDEKYGRNAGAETFPYNPSGHNIPWVFMRCFNAVAAPKDASKGLPSHWNEQAWRLSENPDKFGTIAVTICGDDYESDLKTNSINDYSAGAEISNATENNINKTVYLFTADSGETTQFKDTYTEEEKKYIANNKFNYLTQPINNSVPANPETKTGYIATPIQEEAGPNGITPYNGTKETTDGYNPLSFVAPITGTYAFRFLTNDFGSTNDMLGSPLTTDDTWSDGKWSHTITNESNGNYDGIFSYEANAPYVGMWDITVSDTNQKAQSGRVWTDILHLNMGKQEGKLGSNVYVLTNDGFEYQVNFNNMKPWGFSFFANSRGFLAEQSYDGEQPVYQSLNHSFFSYNPADSGVGEPPVREDFDADGKKKTTKVLLNTTRTNPTLDFNHKIFFNLPDDVAAKAYTDNEIGIRDNTNTETPTNEYTITYTGAGSNANNDDNQKTTLQIDSKDEEVTYHSGTEGIGGYFTILVPKANMTVTASNTISVKLDFSGYKLDSNKQPVRTTDNTWEAVTEKQTEYEKGNIVVLTSNVFTEDGDNYKCIIDWNGKDSFGNTVPPGVYGQVITSCWQAGTAHFPLLDVEYITNGIKMKMLNNITLDDENQRDTIYYNNSGISGINQDKKWSDSAWYFNEYDIEKKKYGPSKYSSINLMTTGNESGKYSNASNGIRTYFDSHQETIVHAMRSAGANSYHTDFSNGTPPKYRSETMAPGDHTAVDIWMRYSTEAVKHAMAIGVNSRNDRSPVTPYVSFVGETSEDKLPTPDKNNKVGTHVGYYTDVQYDTNKVFSNGTWNAVEFPKDLGSSETTNYFGNTISTEFVVSMDPDNFTYNNLNWTINIPSDGTYVKAEQNSGNINLAGNVEVNIGGAVLTDTGAAYSTDTKVSESEINLNEIVSTTDTDEPTESLGDEILDGSAGTSSADDTLIFDDDETDNIKLDDDSAAFYEFYDENSQLYETKSREIGPPKVNKGSIFPITHFGTANTNTESDSGTLRFRYKLPTTITGSATYVFGLVIDNLYSPKATATEIRFGTSQDTDDNSYYELNKDNSVSANDNAQDYYKNENNEYWKVDPNNPNRNKSE